MTESVVVVAYRPHEWLRPCLASVADQADEIIVVDNNSPSGEIGRTAADFGARLIRLDENRGFAGGVNAGIGAARGDIIALLNDDATAGPGWLKAAAALLSDRDVAAVGPKVLLGRDWAHVRFDQVPRACPPDPRPLGRRIRSATVDGVDVLPRLVGLGIHSMETDGEGPFRWTAGFGDVFIPNGEEIRVDGEPVVVERTVRLVNTVGLYLSSQGYGGDIGFEAIDEGQFDRPSDRFGVSGAALVTTRDVLGRIGEMAGSFFAYYEDTDWCWRSQLAGMRICYDPTSSVEHVRWATSGGPNQALPRLLAERNRVLCMVRNAPVRLGGRAALELLVTGERQPRRSLLRHLPEAVAGRVRMRRRWKRTPDQVWATWAGVDDLWARQSRVPQEADPTAPAASGGAQPPTGG